MNYKTLTSLTAILTFINASFFLLVPVFSLALLGRTTDPMGILSTRISGACALGLGVVTWLARNFRIPEVQRLVAIGNLTTLGILVLVDLQGLIMGAIGNLGWLIFSADLLLFIGFVIAISTIRGVHT
jgi:hypothetical protein